MISKMGRVNAVIPISAARSGGNVKLPCERNLNLRSTYFVIVMIRSVSEHIFALSGTVSDWIDN